MSSPIDCFDKVIMVYNKGDIEALIASKLNVAGPLLTIVLNGIDVLGGLCYGFERSGRNNSRWRSIKILDEKFNMPREIAEYIYESVRCGIVHQGQPKYITKYYVNYDNDGSNDILYRDSNCYWLDVVEFANEYSRIIDQINIDKINLIKYEPIIEKTEKDKHLGYHGAISSIKELPDKLKIKLGIIGVSGTIDSTSSY